MVPEVGEELCLPRFHPCIAKRGGNVQIQDLTPNLCGLAYSTRLPPRRVISDSGSEE